MTAAEAGAARIAATGLTVGYHLPRGHTRTVLTDLRLTLEAGRLTCLLGPNGSGKSTLLRTLAGAQRPLDGTVEVAGRALGRMSAREVALLVSVVLSEPIDVGLMTAYDLVALGRYPHTDWLGRLTQHDHEVVAWALSATGSDDLARRPVAELSDGERQRVMVARALAQQPVAMLLDEPTAYVDLPRRVELVGLLRRLAADNGLAVLLATHDLELATRTSDTVWLVDRGGTVTVGAPEDLVLSGDLERVFRSDELTFDQRSGAFRVRQTARGRARVVGHGLAATWAGRALERVGYVLVDDAEADLEVHVTQRQGQASWLVLTDGVATEHRSIGALAAAATGRLAVRPGSAASSPLARD